MSAYILDMIELRIYLARNNLLQIDTNTAVQLNDYVSRYREEFLATVVIDSLQRTLGIDATHQDMGSDFNHLIVANKLHPSVRDGIDSIIYGYGRLLPFGVTNYKIIFCGDVLLLEADHD